MADDPMRRLLTAAKLLYANAEGCAVNHYSDDFAIHGLPGWLADCAADIQAAEQALATPAPSGVREDQVTLDRDLVERAQHQLSASLFPFDRCVAAEISAALSPATAARGGTTCQTCEGRGEIGGWSQGDLAYVSEACPECSALASPNAREG